METSSLSYRTIKNVAYSMVGFAFPILFSVFITPIVVHRLGIETYGIYILVNTILGFLGLLDLGLGAALMKYISEFVALGRLDELREFLYSANTAYALVGLAGLIIFWLLGTFFLFLFHITGTSQHSILIVFLLGGLIFFINTANNVYTTIPAALQRFDLVTKINLAQITFLNLSTLILVLFGFQLRAIFLVNAVSLLVLSVFYYVYSRRLLAGVSLRFKWSSSHLKKMYSFGFFASVSSVMIISLNQLDRLIIPIFLGPGALSYYSLPGNAAQKTATVAGSLSGVFFPLSSDLFSRGLVEKLGYVYRKIIRNLAVMAAAITAPIMVFGYKILFYWLGKDFADKGFVILLILAVTYFLLAVYGTVINFLMGMGKIKFLAWWSFVLAAVNIILMVILIPYYGIVGAAWAFLGGAFPVVIIFYLLEKKYLGLTDVGGFYARLLAKILFTSLIFFLFSKYAVMPLIISFGRLVIIGPLTIVLFLLIYFVLGFFDTEDIRLFKSFYKKIINH
jgi:O-antigen/teichoic acid export membrane protein